ncbi:HIRAN domain-containing protein [Paenibacillus sp. CGMCC 1.18879]|uniref:HIRAN domain-containing protein n=1 Tax=Paenibacillus sp. CGMCC 1.18879 TaxID=2834466 RepID=UPI001CA826B4|nr:HIRAN domain-containing protein [Paenibacillus sp. CGMCC 1.18879]MBY9081016.1 HIRAN domain-containing protein [Paenibacillus sp. CGMCC 1.18879]
MAHTYNKLLVNWKSPQNSTNYAVGTLENKSGKYIFNYNKIVYEEAATKGFSPFVGLSELDKKYVSEKLFSIFERRIPNKQRNDFKKFLKEYGVKSENVEWDYLTITKGRLATDSISFEVPIIYEMNSKALVLSCEAAGWSHTKKNISGYEIDDKISVRLEENNQFDKKALEIVLTDRKKLKIGYIPKPYNQVFYCIIKEKLKLSAFIHNKSFEDDRPMIIVFAFVSQSVLEKQSDLLYMIEYQYWER